MTALHRWMWHWSDLDVTLYVHTSVASFFENHRQEQGGHERGGQLFVDVTRPNGLWLVEATGPHLNDKSGPTWLEMDLKRCREEIEEANARGLRLIGYWHSHPEHVPALSGQDIKSLTKFSQQNTHQLPNPLAVIVGRSLSPEGIRAWIYQKRKALLAEHIEQNDGQNKF
ncbi:Mov34/MPN/PAD-1 family protein [Herminiimonas contaminans]|uniref:Mov34/MPN/PAD-1 family protein n=1 Tax=Herminiimonas contaminans TaxID=1111140 RepID=A0ABS0EWJ8_9BURK|nr:Mov34/MPN/PAD-1 family protein [Herminiimonas contaminans]MBF8179089.1 Mov34/MPN/PAD-1 family protein [Herminiimonas contaminans]